MQTRIRSSTNISTVMRKYRVFIFSPPVAASPCYMNLSQNEARQGIVFPEYYWSVIWVAGSILYRHRSERDNFLPLTPKFFERVFGFSYINSWQFCDRIYATYYLGDFSTNQEWVSILVLIRWSWFESCWYPCHMAQRGPQTASLLCKLLKGFFIFYLFFFPSHWLQWDLVQAQ